MLVLSALIVIHINTGATTMKKFLLMLLFPAACLVAHAQTPCGESDVTTGNLPQRTPNNYTTISLPTQGAAVTDSDFSTSTHCQYYRESTGSSCGAGCTTATYHSYKYSPFNCADTLEIVGTPDIGDFEVINVPSGTVYLAGALFGGNNNNQPMFAHCKSGTTATDQYTVYYINGTQLHSYRVDLRTDTLLHDFASDTVACGTGGCSSVCFGCSSNGPHSGYAANGDDTIGILAQGSNGNWYSFVYDMVNVRIWPGFTPINNGTTRPDSNFSFPDHRMLMAPSACATYNLYDATGTLVHSLGNIANGNCVHSEAGTDNSGVDVLYYDNWADTNPSNLCPELGTGESSAGITKITVDALVKTCVANNGWGGKHISVTQNGQYIATSNVTAIGAPSDYSSCTEAFYQANPSINWQQYFGRPPGEGLVPNEIDLATTDGNTTYRMIHHQSRVMDSSNCTEAIDGSSYDYWAEPRSAISYSGKWIAFDSNYGQNPVSSPHNYTETWVVSTGLGSASAGPPSAPTNLQATVQ